MPSQVLALYQELCRDVDYAYCAFAQAYLYSFCMIFIVVVLNVFIFIIETGYSKAQRTTGSHDEAPIMLDHDRLHRVLEAAEKTVVVSHETHNDADGLGNGIIRMDAMDDAAALLRATDSLASLDVSDDEAPQHSGGGGGGGGGGAYEADDDDVPLLRPLLQPDDSGDDNRVITPSRFTEESLQIEEIIRASVEECTRKVLATRRAAGPGGDLSENLMETEGADALLSENSILRDELAHQRKLVALLKRDLATLSAAVTNLRREQGEPMQHWSVING